MSKRIQGKQNKSSRKPGIIILSAIAILILVFNIIEVGKYMNRKKEAEKYANMDISVSANTPVDLIGLMDSYGVPYSADVPESFYNLLESSLDKDGNLSSSLDLFNLYANKTWQLNGVFRNGITIGEFKRLQNFSIDFTRHKFPSQIKKDMFYPTDEALSGVQIYDYVQSLDNPVIVYSCTANDIFYYFGASPASLTPKKCFNIVSNLNNEAETIGDHVQENLNTLIECNPDSSIYVLGLYLPSDNYALNAVATGVVDKFNKEIKKACELYPRAHYVDVSCLAFCVLSGDFHPNYRGHKVLAAKIGELISNNQSSVENKDKKGHFSIYRTSERTISESELKEMAEKMYLSLSSYHYNPDDYVECAVAFEQALYDNELETMSYTGIETVYTYLKPLLNNDTKAFDKAILVEIAEKKMLNGIIEKENALAPETVKNDKLSYKLTEDVE